MGPPRYHQTDKDEQTLPDRRASDPQVQVLMHKVSSMAQDVSAISQNMAEMTKQMGRLVLVEERGSQTTAALAETQRDLKDFSERMSKLEIALVRLQGSSKWVDMAIIGIVVTACTLAVNKLTG